MSRLPETMDEPEELLDLVNDRDEPIGSISRGEVPSLEERGIGFTRAVGTFVINDQDQLWIPRRSTHKKIAPGGLDFSAGEHVELGESYEAAALRGLHEELQIDAAPAKLKFIGTVPPFEGMPYFHKIFGYRSNVAPDFNRQDYDGYEWLAPEIVADKLASGEPAKEILLPSIQLITEFLERK